MPETTTSPPTRASASSGELHRRACRGDPLTLDDRLGCLQPGATSTTRPPCCSASSTRRCRAGSSTSAAATASSGWRSRRAVPLATVTAVDVNERALLLANDNAPRRRRHGSLRGVPPEQVPRRGPRRDLVQPADPDRQRGAARAAADLARATRARWPDGDGGRQEPRRRLAPALAHRPGLADARLASSSKGFRVLESHRA